jgi:hypothetical protein
MPSNVVNGSCKSFTVRRDTNAAEYAAIITVAVRYDVTDIARIADVFSITVEPTGQRV